MTKESKNDRNWSVDNRPHTSDLEVSDPAVWQYLSLSSTTAINIAKQ